MKTITLTPRHAGLAEFAFWLAVASSYLFLPDKLPLVSQILIMGLFALSLDIALGYAGILTVGHATFFGMGAYCAGLLARHAWNDPLLGIGAALVVCAIAGYLLSYLIVRGGDLARLMITIGVGVLLAEIANRASSLTGGTDGLQGIVMAPLFGRYEFDLWGHTAFWYAFAVVASAFLVVRLMLRSPFGLVLRGIHDNRKRMLALGSPVDARLRLAYCLSAAFAGVAGALLAQTTQFVGIESLGFAKSAEILIILVVGGAGRLYGGMVGAFVYMTLHDVFADLDPQFWMFWLGIFLIAAALAGRGGIMGLLARLAPVGRSR